MDKVKVFAHRNKNLFNKNNRIVSKNCKKIFAKIFVRKRKLNLPSFSCPYLFSIQFLEIRLDKTNSKQIPWPISYHSILEFKPNKKLSAFGISYTCMVYTRMGIHTDTIQLYIHYIFIEKWYERTGIEMK